MSELSDKIEVATAAQASGEDPGSALTIFEKIQKQQEVVAKALPAGMDAGRFVRMVLTEMRRTPKLTICDPATLIGAMMLSAQTGLEPGGPLGQAFLIPRWNGRAKVNEAQFQIGYRGLVQLAARSGVTLQAHTVRDGDVFEWQYGTDEYLTHRPVLDSEASSVAWYATARFSDGRAPMFVVIDRNVTEKAKAAGAAGNRGPWASHYDAMAEKTAAIRLAKWLPLTSDVSYAVAADGAVVRGTDVTVQDAADSVPEGDEEAETEATDDDTTEAEMFADEAAAGGEG